jgi:hypothetical protein
MTHRAAASRFAVMMSTRFICVVTACLGLATGVACGGKAKPKTVASLVIDSAAKTTSLPVAPPFARPGERMAFKIALQNVEVAAFNIAVGEVSDYEGKKALVVQAGAQSLGLAALLEKVDDQFTSWVDITSGRPLLFRSHEGEGNGGTDGVEDADTQFTKLANKLIPVVIKGKTIGEKIESQAIGDTELWDMNAFFLVLRAWQGGIGSKITADVVRSRFMWRTQIELVGKDTQITALGKFPTLRFNGVARRIERDGKEVTGDDRNYSLWITDDADRVPVVIVAKTDFGDVRMEITEYSAGTGARLADGAMAGN